MKLIALIFCFVFSAVCSAADGDWITPPYNAADFTGYGQMNVYVPQKSGGGAGASKGFRYRIETAPNGGKSMTVMLYIDPITITGVVSGAISIKIPDGRIANSFSLNPVYIMDAYIGAYIGYASTVPGSPVIWIAKVRPGMMDGGNFNLSTAQTNILGQITFEIQ